MRKWKDCISKFLAKNRRNRFVRKVGNLLFQFYQGFENRDGDFSTNGEAYLIKTLAKEISLKTIFDVGANEGTWTSAVVESFPQSRIFSFEIVPKTFALLKAKVQGFSGVTPQNLGLSDQEGEVTVFQNPNNVLSTCIPNFTEDFHKQSSQTVKARVSTGDSFCRSQGIEKIDFLKIDTEGYEPKVLSGFQQMLSRGGVSLIQFEYGYLNVETRFLLKEQDFDRKLCSSL